MWNINGKSLNHLVARSAGKIFLLLVCLVGLSFSGVQAQDRTRLSEVWVTTQDYSVLRAGPGQRWAKLTVLPYGVTLKATGRTVEGDWIQVAYQGALDEGAPPEATIDGVTYGWIAHWLLVWSGDILQLPVDGVQTFRTARRSGPQFPEVPEYIYVGGVDPSTRVTDVTVDPERTELTGRIGSPSGGYFWLQFEVDGRYFWTASWDVGVPDNYIRLPDGSYIYAYGRLLRQLRQELNDNGRIFNNIADRWYNLAAGTSTSCNSIPGPAAISDKNFSAADLSVESIYAPIVKALQDANGEINAAIALFEVVCSRQGEDRYVRSEDVQAALVHVQQAQAYLTLARTLLTPLQRRDPLLGNAEAEQPINQP